MSNQLTLTAAALALVKLHVTREIEAMLSSSNVKQIDANRNRVCVYGDTAEECVENFRRVCDAAAVFGLEAGRTKNRRGFRIEAVAFQNDPFNQVKHYFSTVVIGVPRGA